MPKIADAPPVIVVDDKYSTGLMVGMIATASALDRAVSKGVIPLYIAEAIACEVDDFVTGNVTLAFMAPSGTVH